LENIMPQETLRRFLVISAMALGIPAALALPIVGQAAGSKPKLTPCVECAQSDATHAPLTMPE
jgi:hypothetical protein